jgi:hypothetical protein
MMTKRRILIKKLVQSRHKAVMMMELLLKMRFLMMLSSKAVVASKQELMIQKKSASKGRDRIQSLVYHQRNRMIKIPLRERSQLLASLIIF